MLAQRDLVKRTFINQERNLGTADYGTEYQFWHVWQGEQFVPVRRVKGAEVLDRDTFDRLPPGVISRVAVELELAVGTPILMLVRRPKAVRLPKRQRRAFWLTRSGQLSPHPPTARRAPATERATPARAPLNPAKQAELARNLLQNL